MDSKNVLTYKLTGEKLPIKFGTGGWRATIGDSFIQENIRRVAEGVAELMKAEKKTDLPVPIGFDRRFLSDQAAKWIAEVFCGNGINVIFYHRSTPTPLIMFTVKDQKLHYGIEITASHNPANYNGIKLIVEEGRDASVECTEKLEGIIAGLKEISYMPFDDAQKCGLVTFCETPFNPFIDSILGKLDIQAIRERGLRILFNPMHGSGTYPLMVILYTTRCTVDLVNGERDAYFGGHVPAPGKENLQDFRTQVVLGKYDLGIAIDGDGDRLGIIDSNGEYIDANQILVMLYYYLHKYKGWKGPVVRNMSTTHMLDLVAESFGEKCYEVPVGFKYISSKLDEVDAVLGGESSGGLTVRGHIYGKDSVYSSALFVEMLCAMKKSPTEIWKELTEKYGRHEMVEDNLPFDPNDKARIYDKLMVEKAVPNFAKPVKKIGYEDGFKAYFEDNSFVVCRFSGTEPLLRIFAEDETAEKAAELVKAVKKLLNL
ncbi:MAG: phosphoglucomutase/phosphomannomutase family protein [Clostridia bacterium]|nr:phosphoglucomutase/phosphomannomutase family protein [Clostridia bacterium]